MQVKKICASCGKVFFPQQADVNRGRGLVCSKECRYKRQSSLMARRVASDEVKKKISSSLAGIPKSESHKQKLSEAHKGKQLETSNPNWKGGSYISRGRKFIRISDHPNKQRNGYIMHSRYVVEQFIGRYLNKNEEIHHINFNKLDDSLYNLYLFESKANHARFHQLIKVAKTKAITKSNL
jgi:hypothetical protein